VDIAGHVRQAEVAAGRERVPQPRGNAGRVLLSGEEMQDRDQKQRHRLGEIDQFPGFRVG